MKSEVVLDVEAAIAALTRTEKLNLAAQLVAEAQDLMVSSPCPTPARQQLARLLSLLEDPPESN